MVRDLINIPSSKKKSLPKLAVAKTHRTIWLGFRPPNKYPTNRGQQSSLLTSSEVLMWCPMVERRWDPIRYTSWTAKCCRGRGFCSLLEVGSSSNFFDFGFLGLFGDLFFWPWKVWEPGKISPMFSNKKWKMRWWEWLLGRESSGTSENSQQWMVFTCWDANFSHSRDAK